MLANRSPHTLVVGLAFFSMFFGSGNLIFPLMLGREYESHFLIAALGFVITGVLLPTLGILAMIPAKGNYERLFANLIPHSISRWFFLLILVFWIPLGSGPRCVVLAHASISSSLPFVLPLGLFSLLFLLGVYFCVKRPSTIIDILGKFLTPVLLLSIFCIVISSFFAGEISESTIPPLTVFQESLMHGYYTQDLIAAIFFSSALVGMLNLSHDNQALVLKKTLKAGLFASSLLMLLYAALIAASAIHADHLHDLSGEKLVSTLASLALGPSWGGLSSLAVSLACFTTEIALVVVFADFLERHLFRHKKSGSFALLLTLGIIGVAAQLEFAGIMSLIAPAMKLIYPILFLAVIRFLWRSRKQLTIEN